MKSQDNQSTLAVSVWLPAILAGVASMAFTVAFDWYIPVLKSLPVFIAGGVVGYYYRHQSKRAIRIGTRMGLIGGIPLFLTYSNTFDLLAGIDPSQPVWTTAVEMGPLLGLLLLAAGISTLQGFMGTLMGVKTRHRQSAETA